MNQLCLFYFILVLYVLKSAWAISPAQKAALQAKLLSGGLACIKDHPLSTSDINEFRMKMLPDNENAKCFTACLFKRIGIMDEKGMLSPAGARNSAKSVFNNSEEHLSRVDQLIGKCTNVNEHSTMDGNKGCDRAQHAFMCLTEHAPKFNFDIDL